VGTGWSWLRIGTSGGHCQYGNELSGSIKCGEFLDWQKNQLASREGLCSMEYGARQIDHFAQYRLIE
jgi:hypothetical protein